MKEVSVYANNDGLSLGSCRYIHHSFGSLHLHAWVTVHDNTGNLPECNEPSHDQYLNFP